MQTVSAVIPNYNGQTLLKKFLPDVLRCLSSGDELVIVDDNSSDESVKYLIRTYKLKLTKRVQLPTAVSKKYFPQPTDFIYKLYTNIAVIGKNKITIYLVALEKNMRFAAAANIGVMFSSKQYIFLLNNDVKPTKNVRSELIQHFTDPLVFAVGCLEFERDESGDRSGKNKLWFEKGMFMHSKATDMISGQTAWVSGGSGMFDKQKWVFLNGFDQTFYPAYWEDVDLSFQARKNGWKVLFDEKAIVFHVHESTNIDVFGLQKILDMSWRNAVAFVKKNATFWQLLQYYLWLAYWNYKRKKHMQKNKVII